MDSLKTLMDKKEYDLVIKLTEKSEDSISIFYRISALIATNHALEALKIIKQKRKVLQSRLSLLVKVHIELLCLLKKFDEAYEELNYYRELPYENQETEELLRGMDKYIRHEERNQYYKKEVGQEEISQKLLSSDDDSVLLALDQIRSLPLEPYIMPLSRILIDHPRQAIRTLTLLLLVSRKYDKEVSFLHIDRLIKVIPSQLEEPFSISGFKDIKELSSAFQDAYRDPSVSQNALHLLSSYLIYLYPEKTSLTFEEIITIFGYLAKEALRSEDCDLEALCSKNNLDFDRIEKITLKIKEQLKNF